MGKSLKIGFDVSDLSTARADGTTRYTYELAKRLPLTMLKAEWLYFSPGKINENLRLKNLDFNNIISPWPKYWTQLRLPADLYRYRPDILFMPIQQLPYIRPGRMGTVAVIHDLAFHEYGEQFTRKDWILLHAFTAYAARQADRIIAVSQSTADDIARYYGRKENVFTVHHGVDHEEFRQFNREEKENMLFALQEKYPRITKPYLLYIGQIQPRKNLVKLIEAFELLKEGGYEGQLVIGGSHGWLQGPIRAKARESKFSGDIVMAGRIPEELLAAFYAQADLFVLPSTYEGFGMPILEAMACGCPTVTSNVSSMPEIAGGAAKLVDPNQVESIAGGIKNALHNKKELIDKGAKRVQEFSWEKCAKETAQIIFNLDHS